MRAGELDTRVIVKSSTDGVDTDGGVTKTWGTIVYTGYFRVRPVGGTERPASGQVEAMGDYEFLGRYTSTVRPDMQLVVGTRTFAIRSVQPIPRNGSMLVYATERVN